MGKPILSLINTHYRKDQREVVFESKGQLGVKVTRLHNGREVNAKNGQMWSWRRAVKYEVILIKQKWEVIHGSTPSDNPAQGISS